MEHISRRTVLKTAAATAAWAACSGAASHLMANAMGLPIGLQLYSVRDLLPKDYDGTLKQLAAIGYREVEGAGFFGRSASDVKHSMDQAGLNCVSAHYSLPQLGPHVDEVLQFAKDLGLKYIICSSPGQPASVSTKSGGAGVKMEDLSLADWRWNADQFNRIGEIVNAAGIRFGYHNHTAEFRTKDGVVIYDELLRLTDPAKVTMEMDCGWVVVGGKSPADYLRRYPTRFSMLHVKDFNLTGAPASESAPPHAAELGRGSIDYRPIFEAARKANVTHAFVEQEFFDGPPMEALKIDADYMKTLAV
jgi:sugar phosphate isomerase/epimerase